MSAASQTKPQYEVAASAEIERRTVLDRYQILDTPQEHAFDRIVQLAALLLDVPIALISLIDADRQWFKSRYGLNLPETPRTLAFCDHAIRGSNVMVVPDAAQDPRFRSNALVTGDPHIRFYAGAPLVTPDGFALGTICAIDRAPRQLTARDAAVLTALAEQVIHELEVRAALGEMYKEVSEGRRATRTLQGEGARLEALLNATGNAVVTADPDGCIASLNRAAEAMFGFEPGESVGRNLKTLMSQNLDIDLDIPTSPDAGIGWRKDGTSFPIEVSHADWIDMHGRNASGAIVRDCTERRRAESELRSRDAADQAQEKLAAVGRVSGGVAHELNNLLQPVIGLAQLELDSQPVEGSTEQLETRENLTTILDCGAQMRSIVRKILMFSRKSNPERLQLDFRAVLERACRFVGKLLPPGIRVDMVIQSDVCGLATINEAELVEVFTNLAINAAHAMEGNGTLAIAADRLELAEGSVMPLGVQAGAYFRVAVSDTGRGMDAITKARILEPFFTTKPIGQGTGLGLSLVYGVLRDWNGALSVDSIVDVGSTFTLYIPITGTH
ncbi:PAS domain S-box protein [Tardiphaga sp. vice304]|uniref:GAF domain-containing protein n=1 Tax=Tardiphaga sp. vice304 TaxID=2592817 RepID=UPI001161EF5A|nr:GAF domain-containing protein [Tardiphaga sp. vice304]QDM25590.1 PAS domain S-box protein [Tardiphaga sp. vice304]